MFGRSSNNSRIGSRVRLRSEGTLTVACAAAIPLAVMGLAVFVDYAKVSYFRIGVQHAADAASVAAAEAVARQPGADLSDGVADQVADVVFLTHAPRGAGSPNVTVKSSPVAVTATVGYTGLAPSNFGSAFGYDAVSAVASAISPARLADFRPTVAR